MNETNLIDISEICERFGSTSYCRNHNPTIEWKQCVVSFDKSEKA